MAAPSEDLALTLHETFHAQVSVHTALLAGYTAVVSAWPHGECAGLQAGSAPFSELRRVMCQQCTGTRIVLTHVARGGRPHGAPAEARRVCCQPTSLSLLPLLT